MAPDATWSDDIYLFVDVFVVWPPHEDKNSLRVGELVGLIQYCFPNT